MVLHATCAFKSLGIMTEGAHLRDMVVALTSETLGRIQYMLSDTANSTADS